MTSYTKADLEMAELHVAQAEIRLVSQEERVTMLRLHGHLTEDAQDLAEQFAETLQLFREHRDAIADALRSNA